MDRRDELNATDKLLQVIKGKGEISDNHPGRAASPAVKKTTSKLKIFPLLSSKEKKSVNIGIDIGKSHLRLVRAIRKTSREWKILDMSAFQYPPGAVAGSDDHKVFIEQKIRTFCNPEACHLWAISSSENIEIRHIRIPKVAKKDISNAVYWTFKKEFSYEESEYVMDYLVQEEIYLGGTAKLSIMAYIFPKSEIDALKRFFAEMGLEIAGITIRPFAVHNLIRSSEAILSATQAFLFIGDESSRIDIYANGNLTMTRAIKAGTHSMAEALYDGLRETHPDFSFEDAQKILSRPFDMKARQSQWHGLEINQEEVFAFLSPAVDRIVRQAERTFDYYATVYGQASVEKLFLSSDTITHKNLARYLENQLGIACRIFDPAGEGALETSEPFSGMDVADRMAYIPALGAACSEINVTPNLLYGYRDKETAASIRQISHGVLTGFAVLMVLCISCFIYQNTVYAQKKDELKNLESRLASFKRVIDRSVLLDMAGQIQQTATHNRSLAERYQGMAILSEISAVTPREMKLIRLDLDASAGPAGDDVNDPPQAQSAAKKHVMTIEGVIQGEPRSYESILTGFTLKLDSSPVFESVTIQKSNHVPFVGKDALHFVVNAKIS